MPLRDLLGSPRDQPYAADDPRNPKNYYKAMHDRRKADEAAQDRRMSEAYAAGKLKDYQPSQGDGSGVARQTAVQAGAHERKIPGVISHNDALYFATVSGWTHTERWRPSAEDEAERLKREGHGQAVVAGGGDGNGPTAEDAREDPEGRVEQGVTAEGQQRKKSVGDKVKSFVFGAAGVTKE